jgi:hypothetical protein
MVAASEPASTPPVNAAKPPPIAKERAPAPVTPPEAPSKRSARARQGLLDRLVAKRLLRLPEEKLQKRICGLPVAAWILLSGELLVGLVIVLLAYLIVATSRS